MIDAYALLRPLLFSLPPEVAHAVTLTALKWAERLGFKYGEQVHQPTTCMGINFPNRIGLAAGLDKNGLYIKALSALGFGFIEIGTVTPKPQSGNPKPRLFRLRRDEALINRLGFNNRGMDFVYDQLSRIQFDGVLGINIGKNRDTPNDKASQDYLACFNKLAPLASYITINISSPNTQGLRDLQAAHALSQLLSTLKGAQQTLANQLRYVPLVVKISPDIDALALKPLADVLLTQAIDGVIVSNTTVLRDELQLKTTDEKLRHETGGLSGKPLLMHSNVTLQLLKKYVGDAIPIIGVGGIMDVASAQTKYDQGANLLQIYTGLVYRGPHLVSELARMA